MINPCNRPWKRRPLSFTHCFEKPVWKKVTNRGKDYIDFFSSVCVFWRTRTNVFVLGNKGNDLCLSRSMESYTNLFVELCWKISLWKKITNLQWLLWLLYSLWFYKKLKRCPLMTLVNCIFENEWVFLVPEGYFSAQSSDLCSYPLNLWKLKHRLFNKRRKICLDRYNVDARHQKA